jgi:hypothetical protein
MGGGIVVGFGALSGALRCCFEMTGGSFAKMSRKMVRKSRILDFYGRVLASLPLGATLHKKSGDWAFPQCEVITHIPKLCPAH